jgi:hypothetical protein
MKKRYNVKGRTQKEKTDRIYRMGEKIRQENEKTPENKSPSIRNP